MYPDVCKWFKQFLYDRFRSSDIEVYDLSRISLSRFIIKHNIIGLPNEWVTWDIMVDVVGFIRHSNISTSLAFVECKNVLLNLSHLSQLLGYSRIASPVFSFLLSPIGISSSLNSLLREYRRTDVLEYYWEKGKYPRRLIVAKWDVNAHNINRDNIICNDLI